MELLAQKHRLLANAVSGTKEKLETLKTADQQANTALVNGNISKHRTAKAQETGISVDDLMNSVQKNGATFKSMSLNLGQSITHFAQFEQNGVKADTAMLDLRKRSQTIQNRECR